MPIMWYDVVVLGILVFAVIRGAVKGFIWQVAGIAAIVLCFIFAEELSQYVAPFLTDLGVEAPLNRWLAMFVIYLGLSLVVFLVARMLRDMIEKIRLTEYDRHLGALFGLLKGAIFCLVLTFFLVTLSPSAQTAIRGSYSGNAAAIVMDHLHPVLPDEVHEALEPYIHRLDSPNLDLQNSHPPVDESEHSDQHEHDVELTTIEHKHTSAAGSQKGGQDESGNLTTRNRTDLLRSIAAIYTDSSAAQSAIIEEVDSILNGIPDNVSRAVLNDWLADVTGKGPDPDPQTDETSTLDLRILRQLSLFGIELKTLSDALQSRFKDLTRQ